MIAFKKKIRFSQVLAFDLAVFYLCLIVELTVLARPVTESAVFVTEIFWSWKTVLRYQDWMLLKENLLNILMLMPNGFLLPAIHHGYMSWWKGLLTGAGISLCIEVAQLVWHRGLFEWDDIIHNALGFMIGVMIVDLGIWIYKKNKNRRV